MSVLEQIRRCRASRRTVDSTGASRATASKNARTSPVPSSSTGTRRARIRAATGDAGWPTRSRSRRQPAGSVQSTADRTPVAPSLSSVSLALRSWRDTRATAGIAGNSRTNRATAGSSSPRQAWTERTSASTRFRRAARSDVASELSTLGLSVDLAPFSFRGRTYHNVVGAVPGSDARRPSLLIGAHFDSTADTPGADDNASGVAALLECARAIASREPQARVEFVGFDLEELQTVTGRYRVGSRALARAKRARREALGGALILEMVGYRDPRPGTQIVPPFLGIDVPRTGDFLAAVGDTRSRDLLEGFVSAARAAAPDLPLVPYATRLRGWLLPLTRLSDNASFWDARYPSLMLTDTAFLRNPHYHRVSDASATLDYAFMAAVTEATAGALARLADAS